MRCYACNSELTDYEATLKSPNTGDYLDMCSYCLSEINLFEDEPEITSEEGEENDLSNW